MLDPRKKRQHLLFLVNAASGVVTVVVIFFGVVFTGEHEPFLSLLILVAVPAAGISIWRADLEHRGRERDLAKRVAWQAFRALIAWEAVALVVTGFFVFFATSAMAPVPHSHDTAGMAFVIVTPAVVLLALWFTWVRSRRMLDLLWPLPGTAQSGSEPPYWQLKL
jgi:4-hydroxybenzoate polyprenyltransferase